MNKVLTSSSFFDIGSDIKNRDVTSICWIFLLKLSKQIILFLLEMLFGDELKVFNNPFTLLPSVKQKSFREKYLRFVFNMVINLIKSD